MTTVLERATSERFWAKVRGGSFEECWDWLGTMKGDTGYGQFKASRKLVRAHRFAYEDMLGPIPSGLVLDHLCVNKRCVNPWHLEPVTIAVNTRRGNTQRYGDGPRPHCPWGHPYSGANLYVSPDGRRQCRKCHAEHSARDRAKRKAA